MLEYEAVSVTFGRITLELRLPLALLLSPSIFLRLVCLNVDYGKELPPKIFGKAFFEEVFSTRVYEYGGMLTMLTLA